MDEHLKAIDQVQRSAIDLLVHDDASSEIQQALVAAFRERGVPLPVEHPRGCLTAHA